jgi:hypothetical protein
MTRLTRIAHRAPRSLAKGRLEWRRGQRCIAPVQSAWATTDRQLSPRGIIGKKQGAIGMRVPASELRRTRAREVPRTHDCRPPSGCSSVLSHVVTGFLPERCMPVTYGPPAKCSLSLDKSDRRLAAILTCRSTAPTTTKASRAATTHVPSRSFTRRPSLSSSSARSKTNVRVAQREGTKGRRR